MDYGPRIQQIEQRLVEVEKHQHGEAIKYADIERRLTSIEATLNRIMWIVVTAILMAAVSFALQGGFTLGP